MTDSFGDLNPDVLAVLHADAVSSLDDQRHRLAELRARAATLLTAAALTAGFLAADAFGKASSTLFAWLGTAGFVAVAVSATLVLWPWSHWRLHRHPWNLLRDYDRDPLPTVLRDLTYHLGQDINHNEDRLQLLTRFLAAGCIALACEVTLFLIDLGIRR